MQKVERQNIYITKLNERLNKTIVKGEESNKGRKSESERRNISRSLEELPDLKEKVYPR